MGSLTPGTGQGLGRGQASGLSLGLPPTSRSETHPPDLSGGSQHLGEHKCIKCNFGEPKGLD